MSKSTIEPEEPAGVILVFTNPAPGSEAEYNDWYTQTHAVEIVSAVDGISGVRRFRVNPAAGVPDGSAHSYLAIYELSEPVEVVFPRLAAASPGLTKSATLDTLATPPMLVAYDAITERIAAV